MLRRREAQMAVLLLALLPALGGARSVLATAHPERGRLEALAFAPADYGASPQNWAVVQGPRGLVYVGNTDGVLEYDGVDWRWIPTDRRTAARSLALGADGRIYVGGQAEIGYLEPDETGAMRFVSLNDQIPEAARSFADIWWTLATDHGIYFQSQQQIFRWRDGKITSWHLSDAMLRMFQVGQRILLKDHELGLLELEGDTFQPVPGAETVNPLSVAALLAAPTVEDPSAMLLVTSEGAAWRHALGRFTPVAVADGHPMTIARVYHGRTIRPGLHALATLGNGLVLIDDDGDVVDHLDETNSLTSNNVYSFATDLADGLWIGLSTGVVRVSPFSPVSRFDGANGLPDIILGTVRHEGRLFVASTQGLYELVAGAMRRVDGIGGPVWDIEATPHGLLIAERTGLYLLRGGEVRLLAQIQPTMVLEPDPATGDRWWFGHSRGLSSTRFEGGRWIDEGIAVQTTSFVRSIAAAADGRLVLGTEQDGVVRLDPQATRDPDGRLPEVAVERFGPAEGLTSPNRTQAVATPRGVRIWNESTVFRFAPGEARLEPDPELGAMLEEVGIERLEMLSAVRDDGALVLSAVGTREFGLAVPSAEGYSWGGRALTGARGQVAYGGRFDTDGVLWLATDGGLFRFASTEGQPPGRFSARVRRVAYLDSEAPLFDGGFPGTEFTPEPTLPFTDRALRFEYSAGWFERPGDTVYQVRLQGLSDSWSEWTSETYRDFTNLREGAYRFEIRARNVYGDISDADAFAFAVLPPWYRTPWAYAVYGLAALLLLWAVAWGRTRALQAEKLRLERIVSERTADLEVARRRAESAAAAKSSFLATISHEIRTPLNAILGFSRLGRHEENGDEVRKYLGKIDSAGSTLLALVNDVLDLSRIEAGKLSSSPVPFDLLELLAEIEELFELQARDQHLTLTVAASAGVPRVVEGDPLRLRQVLLNLIGNALKFTLQGTVEVTVEPVSAEPAPEQGATCRLRFSVRDTGIGIDPDRLESLFEPFTQADTGSTRRHGGAGLGLSIARHIVTLLGGELQAESTPGEGSCFSFELDLPIRDVAATSIGPEEAGRLDGLSILLAEDNPINQEIATHMLAAAGARVRVAEDGAGAVEAVAAERFDAVLMDLHMPRMDGREATRRIRTMPGGEQLPIIAMTAHAITGVRDRCLADGMNDYVAKPFEPAYLVEVLQRWTRGAESPATAASVPPTDHEGTSQQTLEAERALARVGGDTVLYARLLADFLVRYRGYDEQVGEHVERREFEAAGALLHSLAGVTANLGAELLAAEARALEQALRRRPETLGLSARLAAFSQRLREAVAAIEEQIAQLDAPPGGDGDVPADAELVDELRRCLETADPVAETIWQQLRPEMAKRLTPARLADIDRAIDGFDYRTALRALGQLPPPGEDG